MEMGSVKTIPFLKFLAATSTEHEDLQNMHPYWLLSQLRS